ncbi:energy-coupling factor transporter transmembrane component T family protein [Alkalicoccobacillus murimartini]|uniref:Energy-coupling factor transport system permease protein n=1 Tax=Alkalicoccobacillus murimartini TaxID=171685 RepID=A0ABT9YN42_9BACI|nr:energy-coupling factor transporter transmembrane component T [Alkalicoccobacillus murimartini]MDQ0209298.1 energy-coupling factor transport system permease protein [Alkalicoccobacillus murimartini]
MSYSIIGQYVPAQSFMHKLDARSKIVCVFTLAIVIFLAGTFQTLLVMAASTIVLAFFSRIPVHYYVKSMKPVLILITFFFLFHLFFTRDGTELYSIGPVAVYSGGVAKGSFVALRILTLLMFASFLTLTTKVVDLTDGLERLLSPLQRVKVPVHEMVLMMSIALRYIPILMQETEKLSRAQAARGADLTTGPVLSRIKALYPLLLPLIVQSFKRAETMAQAMEARGYQMGAKRTYLRELTWRTGDTLTICFTVITTVGIIFLRS